MLHRRLASGPGQWCKRGQQTGCKTLGIAGGWGVFFFSNKPKVLFLVQDETKISTSLLNQGGLNQDQLSHPLRLLALCILPVTKRPPSIPASPSINFKETSQHPSGLVVTSSVCSQNAQPTPKTNFTFTTANWRAIKCIFNTQCMIETELLIW